MTNSTAVEIDCGGETYRILPLTLERHDGQWMICGIEVDRDEPMRYFAMSALHGWRETPDDSAAKDQIGHAP